MVENILRDDAPSANHGELSDRHATNQRAVSPDGRAAKHGCGSELPFAGGARESIVRERDPRPEEHIVPDRYTSEDRNVVLDLDTAPEPDSRVHIDVLPEIATSTNDRTGAYVSVVPYRGARADLGSALDDRGRVDEHARLRSMLHERQRR